MKPPVLHDQQPNNNDYIKEKLLQRLNLLEAEASSKENAFVRPFTSQSPNNPYISTLTTRESNSLQTDSRKKSALSGANRYEMGEILG